LCLSSQVNYSYTSPPQLGLSLCLALAVLTGGQETDQDAQDDGRDDRANRGCSLPFCAEFSKNPFKIKEKIIGLKTAAKSFIRTKIESKSNKIKQIKNLVGDFIDTK